MTSRASRRAATRAGLNLPTSDTLDNAESATAVAAIPASARRIAILVGAVLGILLGTVLGGATVAFGWLPLIALPITAVVFGLLGGALLWHASAPGGTLVQRLGTQAEAGSLTESIQQSAIDSAMSHLQAPPTDAITLLSKSGWRTARPDERLPFVVAASAKGAVLISSVSSAHAEDGATQVRTLLNASPELAALPVVLLVTDGPAPRLDGVITTTRAKLTSALSAAVRK